MTKIDNIFKEISDLKVLELVQLAKLLEERWQLAQKQQVVQINNNGKDIATSGHTITLVDVGQNKIGIIKELKTILNLGLKEVKLIIDSLPKVIMTNVPTIEAEMIKTKLISLGATTEISNDH